MEYLQFEVNGKKVIDMSRIEFTTWMIGKLNGLPGNTADAVALRLRAANPGFGRMDEHEKIEVCRKMENLGIFYV